MRSMILRSVAATAVMLVVAGCNGNKSKTATTVQLEKIQAMQSRSQQHQRDMVGNAVVKDMSLAEFHFVPHSTELSGSGVHQLDRMAVALDTYGGTVHYSADVGDAELVAQRIDHVREYLAMTGCNMDRVKIETGLPGGDGGMARRALKKQQQMDAPPQQSSAPAMLGIASQ